MIDNTFTFPIHVVGAGGIGTWLLPALVRMADGPIVIWDGDEFEDSNLARQLFPSDAIGRNKAEVMAESIGLSRVTAVPRYFSSAADLGGQPPDFFICCADNHAARKYVLDATDDHGADAYIGGNEYIEASAYFYYREWKDHPALDPRVRHPEIGEARGHDPTMVAGCIEEADTTPQLVVANQTAAALLMRLITFHNSNNVEVSDRYWPVMLEASTTTLTSYNKIQMEKTYGTA